MPEFTGRTKKIYREYYDIVFQKDGYPSRYRNGERIDHPLYGAYVINHYLSRYNHGEDSLLPFVHMVAEASLKRMTKKDDALMAMYPKGFTRAEISGLTQSRYLVQFANLSKAFPENEAYKEAAYALFNSYLIPISEGGFCHRFEHGLTFEEYPEKPVSYVLNGWLTALWNLHLYSEVMNDSVADSVFLNSCNAMAQILPLYDFPEEYNSLYQLTAFQLAKFQVDDNETIEILDATVKINEEESYPITVKEFKFRNRYTPFFDEVFVNQEGNTIALKDDRVIMNLVISLISSPAPNYLHLKLKSSVAQTAEFYLDEPTLTPMNNFSNDINWEIFNTQELTAGVQEIVIPIPLEEVRTNLVPTKFSKKVEGKFHNAYHYIHIDKLKKLHEVTGIPAFKVWADRWEAYIPRWPEVESLQDDRISLDPI